MPVKRFHSYLHPRESLDNDFGAEQSKEDNAENQDNREPSIGNGTDESNGRPIKKFKDGHNGYKESELVPDSVTGFPETDILRNDATFPLFDFDLTNDAVGTVIATHGLDHKEVHSVNKNIDENDFVVDDVEYVVNDIVNDVPVNEIDVNDVVDCNDNATFAMNHIDDHLVDFDDAVNDHDNEIDFVVGYDVVVGHNNDQIDCNINDVAIESTVCCASEHNVDVCLCDDCFLQRVVPVKGPARRSCPGHSIIKIGMCTICGQSLDNGEDVDDDFEI